MTMSPTVPVEVGAATSSAPKLFCGPHFAAQPAQRLKDLIDGLKFEEALSLNAAMAEEMAIEWNGEGRVEWWFLKEIKAIWGEPARERAQRAWANARREAAERLTALSARLEATKPKVGEAKAKLAGLGERLAAPKPKIEEAQAEAETLPTATLVPLAEPLPLPEPLLLNPAVPFDNAEKLIEAYHWHAVERVRTLVHYQGEFWKWDGTHWAVIGDDTLRSNVWKQLHIADKFGKRGRERFEPKTSDVNATVDALKGSADLPPNVGMPEWFGTSPVDDPRELVACQNGLLHLPTRRLLQHTPRFWSPNVLEFGFDPKARAVRFEQLLREIFPEDRGAQDGLLEMFGLCLTDITKFQKAFMFVGPTRGGRGTIGRVLQGLVGGENYIGTSLRSLSEPFGMESYIGKKIVVYTDARIDGLQVKQLSTIAERLLAITGEDALHINRKNQRYFDGKLTARIILFANELPRLQDDSGALARRFVTWRMRQSFPEDRADPELTPKLLAERAGILNLALDALDRLRARGRFIQHQTGEGMAANLTDLTSSVKAFVEECCAIDTKCEILVDTLFNRFRGWCEQKGIRHAIGSNHFSAKIEAAAPTVTASRPRKDNPRRLTMFYGIGLRQRKE